MRTGPAAAMEHGGFKSVLVSYLERRKVFKIPNCNDSDIAYLGAQFKKAFSLGICEITFQRFDQEWGMPIDLEPNESINDKDKLIAIVSLNSTLSCSPSTSSKDLHEVSIAYGQYSPHANP